MLRHVGCLKEVQGNAYIIKIPDIINPFPETTSYVYEVSVKCSNYGFRPAKCMKKNILEERCFN